MAGLQELRKRLRSIKATGQVAGAMRSGATAKYSRLSRTRREFTPYSEACAAILAQLGEVGIVRESEKVAERNCFILFGGNRGFCGGFNSEMMRYFRAELSGEAHSPVVLACGRKAVAFCRENGIAAEEYPMADIPRFDEAKAVAARVKELFVTGAACEVHAFYQQYANMLTQTPGRRQILPGTVGGEAEESAPLFLPDRDAIGSQLAEYCLETEIFELMLEHATGAQASTQMAMRSACDNAEKSAAQLETAINRRRQAEITAGVIETASGSIQQEV